MHIHLIGVCGTGMGALAGLLASQGHRVTGSDRAFDPPMGPALLRWGVETMPGWDPANLEPAPDLVVVGNVCRPNNPEARAAIDGGLAYTSFPGAMEARFLRDRPSLVVAGTHGKTTTTSLVAHLLREGGTDPGFLVGGIPRNFDASFRLGGPNAPFAIEGDEYDCAFFEKKPKFWRYHPKCAVLTSVEHDHIDIYPDEASYLDAFRGFIDRIPEDGLLIAYAGDPHVRALAASAHCGVRFYALEGDDTGGVPAIWTGALGQPTEDGGQPIDLFGGGTFLGRVHSPLSGAHNARNVVAAIALATEGAGVDVAAAMNAMPKFAGVRRRQELLAVAGGVRVYDDFAHHPTAVRETLAGLRRRHPSGKLIAAFEPRSATASRSQHQAEYPDAFASADVAVLAPVGRPEIDASEKLDIDAIVSAIGRSGHRGVACGSLDEVRAAILDHASAGDTVVLMSNGFFGGLHDQVIAGLTLQSLEPLDR